MLTWQEMNGRLCPCGKTHSTDIAVISGRDALLQLPCAIQKLGGRKVFVLCDPNTYKAAGEAVCALLQKNALPHTLYTLPHDHPVPHEETVGSVMMHYDCSCDVIVAVGSGVINDVAKILSCVSGKPFIVVATAPSMDGYASASSSMERDGLKTSLATRAPDVIIGDSAILCAAPRALMQAGLGDMLAKYVSLAEWRIANLLLGEYYCEDIAALVRSALKKCADNAEGLLRGEEAAVMAVFEGLVIGGIAMNYAGLSRPASGCEHYISHVLDMRGVSLGTPTRLHGIQVAVGTLICARLYDKLRSYSPDPKKAEDFVAAFCLQDWNDELRKLLGSSADSMIAQEAKEQKYDKSTHPARLQKIVASWNSILAILEQELPAATELEKLLDTIGAPKTLEELGTSEGLLPTIFAATKDIRDKYVLSRLCWDLGLLEESFFQ